MGRQAARGCPSRRGSSRWHFASCILALLLLIGCRSDERLFIETWTLEVADSQLHVELTLPTHIDEHLPKHDTAYTLTSRVSLPPSMRGRDLELQLPFLPANATLTADGRPALPIERDPFETYRSRGPHRWHVTEDLTRDGSLELVLLVEHRWVQSAWIETVPRLLVAGGHDAQAWAIRHVNEMGAAFCIIGMTVLGIAYIAVYLVDRTRKAYLWFTIQGLTAACYGPWYLGHLRLLLGPYDTAFETFVASIAPVAGVYFTHAHFQLPRPSRIWLIALMGSLFVSIVSADPFASTTWGGKAAASLIAITIGYHLVLCARLLRRRPCPAGAGLVFCSWATLGASAAVDLLYWFGFGSPLPGFFMILPALGVFSTFQALVLSREHIATLIRSDALNSALALRVAELERNQREIQVLNDELRRQVSDRSRRLFGALALIGSAESARELQPGETLQGRYRVLRRIASGGMGSVYEVVRLVDERRLALKVASGLEGRSLARLAREAQMASQVSHPNLVSTLDVDVDDSGLLFIVLELVEGSSLDALEHRFGDVPWALQVLCQVAEGLCALHDHGIVHRDLKPANVLVTEDRRRGGCAVKIADFGISRFAATLELPAAVFPEAETLERTSDDDKDTDVLSVSDASIPIGFFGNTTTSTQSALTMIGEVAGTPAYMAPEVMSSTPWISPAIDVFSFGVLAHLLLTRQMPFERSLAFALHAGKKPAPAQSLQSACPSLPTPVAAALDACLQISPELRPTAVELADVLTRAAGDFVQGSCTPRASL